MVEWEGRVVVEEGGSRAGGGVMRPPLPAPQVIRDKMNVYGS